MGRKRAQIDVTLKLLLDIGDVRPGQGVLHVTTRDQTRQADLKPDGTITFEGKTHRSLSSFAVAAIRSCGSVDRKTANGWQVVNYRGRPLEQYRAEFMEKQSQDSDCSHEAVDGRKRRIIRNGEREGSKSGSETEVTFIRSDSGKSSTEALLINLTKPAPSKRRRPTFTWFDLIERERDLLNQKSVQSDVPGGLTIEKGTEEEDEAHQTLAVNMWLKKALNKRHREECGII